MFSASFKAYVFLLALVACHLLVWASNLPRPQPAETTIQAYTATQVDNLKYLGYYPLLQAGGVTIHSRSTPDGHDFLAIRRSGPDYLIVGHGKGVFNSALIRDLLSTPA